MPDESWQGQLTRYANRGDVSADLIVLGSHGYTGIKRFLLGSVALSVVSHAPCSVEVVRRKQEKTE